MAQYTPGQSVFVHELKLECGRCWAETVLPPALINWWSVGHWAPVITQALISAEEDGEPTWEQVVVLSDTNP